MVKCLHCLNPLQRQKKKIHLAPKTETVCSPCFCHGICWSFLVFKLISSKYVALCVQAERGSEEAMLYWGPLNTFNGPRYRPDLGFVIHNIAVFSFLILYLSLLPVKTWFVYPLGGTWSNTRYALSLHAHALSLKGAGQSTPHYRVWHREKVLLFTNDT